MSCFDISCGLKNNLEKKLPISKRGIKGDLNFSCFVILRNVLCDVKISSTHAVILRSVLCDMRISSFIIFIKKNWKDEILTPSQNEGSGWRAWCQMRSSRLLNTKPQDDTFGVRWDPHTEKHRSAWLMKGTSPSMGELIKMLFLGWIFMLLSQKQLQIKKQIIDMQWHVTT